MVMRVRGFLGALALLASVVTACGEQRAPAATRAPDKPEPPIVLRNGELMVSCMGGFPVSESELLRGVEAKDERLVAEARSFLSRHRDDDPERWSLLGEYEDEHGGVSVAFAILGPDGPGPDTERLAGRRADGRWMVWSAGPCRPEPLLAGDPGDSMWVNVQAPEGTIDRAAKVIGVRVSEVQCTGSRDPRPFLHEPVVVETETDVTVYWTSTPPGEATCPGNKPFPVELTLPSPLGDRTLLDGSTYPPREIG